MKDFSFSTRMLLTALVMGGTATVGAGMAQGANLENHALALSGRTDQFGPGFSAFGDNTFGQFGRPTISNAGQVAFGSSNSNYSQFQNGSISIGSLMLYTPNAGLELIARAEGSGGGYNNVETPFLSESGAVGFRGFAVGSNTGFLVKPSGQGVTTVAAVGGTGNAAPPIAGTSYNTLTTFGSFGFRGDHMAFAGTMSVGSGGVTFNSDDFMARADGVAQATFLTREGESGSNPLGTDNGSRTWGGNFVPTAVNSRGDVAFLSTFTGGSFGLSMWGKVDGVTGDVTTLALQGTTVPGTASGYTFLQGAGRIDMNDAGDTVFMGRSGTSQPNVLVKNVAGTASLIAKANDVIDGVTISGFSSQRDPVITGNGTVLFEANITTGPAGSFGVFKHDAVNGNDMLFATGDEAFGPGNGLRFTDIHSLSANASGDFTFYAQLGGTGVTGSNDEAFFTYRNGTLEIIAREGDMFDVDPTAGEELHRIALIANDTNLINIGGQDGRRSNINDNGDVVFSLIFNDVPSVYTAGVFINSVPEPVSLSLLGAGGLLVLPRRRRR